MPPLPTRQFHQLLDSSHFLPWYKRTSARLRFLWLIELLLQLHSPSAAISELQLQTTVFAAVGTATLLFGMQELLAGWLLHIIDSLNRWTKGSNWLRYPCFFPIRVLFVLRHCECYCAPVASASATAAHRCRPSCRCECRPSCRSFLQVMETSPCRGGAAEFFNKY